MGDVLLLEDLNSQTTDEQTTMFDINEVVYGEVMTIWNCNGSLRTDVRYFEDTLKNTDIAMYTEVHQCMTGKLLDGQVYCPQPWTPGTTRAREEWLCYTKRSSMIE